jgi:pyruvate,water dikinase
VKPPRENSFIDHIERLIKGQKNQNSSQEELSFRLMYDRFREILMLNDSLHHLIVDVEEKLAGRSPFLIEAVLQKVRQGFLDTLIMVKELNQLTGDRYSELYNVLSGLSARFEALAETEEHHGGPLCLPLTELTAKNALEAGAKMANLGEVRNSLSLPAPEGFAITISAFNLFMSENGLWERAHQLKRMLTHYGSFSVERASREVREAILAAPVPARLEEQIYQAFDQLSGDGTALVAMRSSAIGEDLASSHAGQYYSELKVSRQRLMDAYRMVLASLYKPYAMSYSYERGQSEAEAMMAVGCLRMIEPTVSGILFSRNFRDMDAEQIEISFTLGLADKVVQGERNAEQCVLSPKDIDREITGYLSPSELKRLYEVARRIESHFECPQDIEWAIDHENRLIILQARQMTKARPAATLDPGSAAGMEPILSGGQVACPGAGCGPVFLVAKEDDLDVFPNGAVAVGFHSSPAFSRIMTRAAAVITEIGSPIGHMAIIAREFGVPAIVGLKGAMKSLSVGQVVTVDAGSASVYDGAFDLRKNEKEAPSLIADSPSFEILREVAPLVTPLSLIDPAGADFNSAGCKSLHDITRFVHEKLYESMFQIGDKAQKRLHNTFELEADFPIEVRIFDIGGGLASSAAERRRVRPEEVVSAPFQAILKGLSDTRIDWRKPRAVSAAGLMSVVGASMLGPPPDASSLGTVSFVVVSDTYLNFSIKAGYHFSTIDALCDRNQHNNYINFRFAGGGASDERRVRRLRFLTEILRNLDFMVSARGDLLIARLERLKPEDMCLRLADLGRLTMCSRQLDMLMDSDQSPLFFSKAFLNGEFDNF